MPLDTEINEPHHVAEKMRTQTGERRPVGAMRHLQLQHHDGDDDGDDAVAECRQTVLAHGLSPLAILRGQRPAHRSLPQGAASRQPLERCGYSLATVMPGLNPATFIMDARVIGVRKYAALRTAMPAHDK